MDYGLWDPPYYRATEESKYENYGCSSALCFSYGHDVIEDTALDEKCCIQVLRILINKADTDIVELEGDLVHLQKQLFWNDEEFSNIFSLSLKLKIDSLHLSIRKLKDKHLDDDVGVFSPTSMESAECIDDILEFLFRQYFKKENEQAFERYLTASYSQSDQSLSSKRFQECKDLAARLSGFFVGIAVRNKYRELILKVVKDGVEYAFVDAPQNLSFLVCAVINFASKLLKPDNIDILNDVKKRTIHVNINEDPSGWRPYSTFIDSLLEKCSKNEEEKEGPSVRRRGRPRKKPQMEGKKLFVEENSSDDGDSISISDEEKQGDEDEGAPLIHSIRASAKLRSLRVSRDEDRGQTSRGYFAPSTENLAASRTSGASSSMAI